MVTHRETSETLYYDLQELTFIPGLPDKEAAWVEKVLSLGHPEDWAEGIRYTRHVGSHSKHLYVLYVRLVTSELSTEYTTHRQTYEVPRELARIQDSVVWEIPPPSFPINFADWRGIYGSVSEVEEEVSDGRWNWYGEAEDE